MYAPRVLFSMIGVLLVFAVVTYSLNGSVTVTLLQTVLCAVLIQVGYFLAVLYLVWRKAREKNAVTRTDTTQVTPQGDTANTEKLSVTGLNHPGHFNP